LPQPIYFFWFFFLPSQTIWKPQERETSPWWTQNFDSSSSHQIPDFYLYF
jgi:hypothetical protein